MKILTITNLFPTRRQPNGGVFVERRVEALRADGHTVELVALRPVLGEPFGTLVDITTRGSRSYSGRDALDQRAAVSPIELVRQDRSGFPSERRLRQVVRRLDRHFDLQSFDVIHGHGMYLLPAGAVAARVARWTRVPYAVTLHGSDVNLLMPRRAHEYAEVLNAAGAVSYVSTALRNTAREHGAAGRNATVIPNGVDCTVFTPQNRKPRPWNPSSQPRVAFVGNLATVKGVDRLPSIFSGISAALPATSFVIVGDGPLRDSLADAMAGLDITFLGTVPPEKVARTLRGADLVLLPSRSEGWPCVILESHASGTPTIGAAVGGIPEAIDDPRLVIPADGDLPQEFINRSVDLLNGVLTVDRCALRARALHFDWRCLAKREADMLHQAAQQ